LRHSTEARATVRLCRLKEKCLKTDLKCVNGWSSDVLNIVIAGKGMGVGENGNRDVANKRNGNKVFDWEWEWFYGNGREWVQP